jgi:oxygen-dependent protoporphyrinogen oxidase
MSGAPPPTVEDRFRVVIAGAGIAGLACAHRLLALARERGLPIRLTVLEASGRPGGVIVTDRVDGCLVEGGPDCFVSDRPWALDLCRRAGLAEEIIGTNADHRRSFVYTRGRLLPIPEGYQLIAPGRLLPFAATPILSLRGRLRAACDLVLPRGPELPDESLAAFVTRRFGRETLDRLAQPLLAGIYNVDPERLSLRATMPRFLDLERTHRSVILGLLRERRRAPADAGTGVSGARYSLFVTLRAGLQTLTDRLAASLPPGSLRLGTTMARLEPLAAAAAPEGRAGPATTSPGAPRWRASTYQGERFDADAAILALPAWASAQLVRPFDRRLADLLAGVPYGGAAAVSLAYRRADVAHPLDGFGFVVPRSENRRLVACSFSSVKFAGRAPADRVLLRAFLDGRIAEGADHASLERIVRDELRDILGITAAPLLARSYVHPRSMAQYEVGHLDRARGVDERLAGHAGLALAGNGLGGVGLPDCVRSGEVAAESVLARAGVVSLAR